jgi:glutamyl-tRNA synthetase
MEQTADYTLQVLGIERNQERPRKDIVMWSEVPNLIKYFYDDQFAADGITDIVLPAEVSKEDATKLLQTFIDTDSTLLDKEAWVENSRTTSEKLGFARELKAYKESPTSFKGHVGHLMAVLRFALTHQLNAPDLYQVMKVMGHDRVKNRLDAAIKEISK